MAEARGSSTDGQESYVEDQTFTLADLVQDLVKGGEPAVIVNRTFVRCTLRGPAILAPMGKTSFTRTTLEGSLDALFWEVEEGRTIVGAVGARDCQFIDCTFPAVGIAGPAALRQKILDELTPE